MGVRASRSDATRRATLCWLRANTVQKNGGAGRGFPRHFFLRMGFLHNAWLYAAVSLRRRRRRARPARAVPRSVRLAGSGTPGVPFFTPVRDFDRPKPPNPGANKDHNLLADLSNGITRHRPMS